MSLKSRFVQSVLADESRRLLRNQSLQIERKLHLHSHHILNRRHATICGGDDFDGELAISHVAYLRFLDLRRIRRGEATVLQARKIHNRFVFGHFGSIAKRLANDLTDDVVSKFKSM